MAVYSKLLLNAGGGIISAAQQAEQVKNTATILIGLGGTGIDCIRTIKTQVYSRLKPDNPEAAEPEYGHIRFLGVDSHIKHINREEDESRLSLGELDDEEFFSMAHPNISKAFSYGRVLKLREEMSWLRWDSLDIPRIGNISGIGSTRQIGRFMLMDKSSAFLEKLEYEICAAKAGLRDPSVNIHIFSGLSGGTGGGCFLDVDTVNSFAQILF